MNSPNNVPKSDNNTAHLGREYELKHYHFGALRRSKQIKQLVSVHGFQACIFCIDDSVRNRHFELLQAHDSLFHGTTHDEAMDIDNFALTQPVRSIHCLQ